MKDNNLTTLIQIFDALFGSPSDMTEEQLTHELSAYGISQSDINEGMNRVLERLRARSPLEEPEDMPGWYFCDSFFESHGPFATQEEAEIASEVSGDRIGKVYLVLEPKGALVAGVADAGVGLVNDQVGAGVGAQEVDGRVLDLVAAEPLVVVGRKGELK